MYFDEIELNMLTKEQLDFKDKDALRLTKKNCLVLADLFKVKDAQNFPKPDLRIADYYRQNYYLVGPTESHYGWLNSILRTATKPSNSDLVIDMQGLSNIAYFFACNGYIISLGDYDDWYTEFKKWVTGCFGERIYLREDLKSAAEHLLEFTKVKQNIAPADPTKVSMDDLGVRMVSEGSAFPEDLASHLAQYGSIDLLVGEVCRIMMLGPKYKRADDAMNALLDAWKTMEK